MHTHGSKRARQGFRPVELLVMAMIPCILAAIVIPRYTDASQGVSRSKIRTQLQTIRSAIELYNVQNPATAYNAGTPVGTFWNHLVQGNYLQAEPENHLQNNSTVVAAAPGVGVGWVWAEATPGEPWTLNLYAVDENAGWFDGDGDGNPD